MQLEELRDYHNQVRVENGGDKGKKGKIEVADTHLDEVISIGKNGDLGFITILFEC